MPSDTPRVAILYDPPSADAAADEQERWEVVESAQTALRARGESVILIALRQDPWRTLRVLLSRRPRGVLNLVEGWRGDPSFEPLGAILCETAAIPYSGNPPHALALASSKLRLKAHLRCHRIPTPFWIEDPSEWRAEYAPYIVKSARAHGSLGLGIDPLVEDPTRARSRLRALRLRHGQGWFLERYLEGREFHISMVAGPDTSPLFLPHAETVFHDWPQGRARVVGYRAKWRPTSQPSRSTRRRFLTHAVPERSLVARLERLGRRVWDVCGLDGYARIDVREDRRGRLHVIDVNPNPSLHPDAGFAAAARAAGLDYAELLSLLLPRA